jgi:hypothetical protein
LRIFVEVLKSLKKTAPFAFVDIGFISHIILANTRIMAVSLSALLGFFLFLAGRGIFVLLAKRGPSGAIYNDSKKVTSSLQFSVTDGPMMLIPDVGPGFFLIRIPDLDLGSGSRFQQQKRGGKKINYLSVILPFL